MTYRLGVDVGGTFTDVLLINEDTGETFREKTVSTPADQSVGVLRGISAACRTAGVDVTQIREVLHGTTVATNAILEEGRARRPGDDRRIPPSAADRPVLRSRGTCRLDHLAEAGTAGGAGGHRGGHRTDRQGRHRRDRPRRGRCPRQDPDAEGAGHRGAEYQPAARVCPRRARTQGRCHRRRGTGRDPHLPVLGRAA